MGSDASTITIGDVAKIKHGFAFKGEYFTQEAQANVLVTPGNFAIGGGFQVGKPKYYSGPVPDDYVLSEGDLIVTMTDLSKGTDTLGYAAKVPPGQGTTYLHNQRVGLVQMKSESIVRRDWLHYLMRTERYRAWIIGSASGTTVKHTSPSRIESFEFIPPPVEQQDEAVKFLNALEGRIDVLLRTNAVLEAIAQALFKSWFVDFDPVRAKAEGREPEGMDAATAALFPDTFKVSGLGSIPEGWEVSNLGDQLEILSGGTPKTRISEYWDGDIPWFSVVDAPKEGQVFVFDTERRITQSGLENSPARLLPANTTIISARGTVGKLAVTGQPMAMNQSCYGLRPADGVGESFTYFSVQRFVDHLQRIAHGAVFDTITRSSFSQAQAVKAPKEIISAFEALVTPFMERVHANGRQAITLTQLRDTLLPRLISGKLRLPEAEREIEAAIA